MKTSTQNELGKIASLSQQIEELEAELTKAIAATHRQCQLDQEFRQFINLGYYFSVGDAQIRFHPGFVTLPDSLARNRQLVTVQHVSPENKVPVEAK